MGEYLFFISLIYFSLKKILFHENYGYSAFFFWLNASLEWKWNTNYESVHSTHVAHLFDSLCHSNLSALAIDIPHRIYTQLKTTYYSNVI